MSGRDELAGADAPREATTLDIRGQPCPIPVIELAKHLRDAPVGTVVELLSDDVGAKVDIPVWCRMQRQTMRGQRDIEGGGWAFLVEKTSPTANRPAPTRS